MIFRMPERNGDTVPISGVNPTTSPAAVKPFEIANRADIGRFQFVQICIVRYPPAEAQLAVIDAVDPSLVCSLQ